MQLIVRSKNLELTEQMRDYAEQKFNQLDRYLNNIIEATVELSAEHTRSNTTHYIVQVNMLANGTFLRAEERAGDLYTAIDAVADLMQKRMLHAKDKLTTRGRTAAGRSGAKVSAATVARQMKGEQIVRKNV
jgi:putative sigma-54 modulation protein